MRMRVRCMVIETWLSGWLGTGQERTRWLVMTQMWFLKLMGEERPVLMMWSS
jgi:low temperature requirement protein LtrA